MKSQGATRLLATLAVLLLVAQPVAAASVGTGHQYRSPSSSDSGDFGDEDGFSDEEFDEETGADVVYVKQNGDAVLVYNSSGSEDAGAEVGTGIGEEGEKKAGDTYASFGADISAGLMHFLANGTVGFDKFDGTMNYLVEPNSSSLNASFSTGLDAVKRLSVDVSGVTNDRRSNLDADMSAKIRSKFAALLSNSGTSGRLVVRADSLVSSGNLSFG
ncbi:MAG: hypothetical protein SV760_10240, partial [Halobacteria archaeon]|nr:hypothetical protein [Halobacteria archaeon]